MNPSTNHYHCDIIAYKEKTAEGNLLQSTVISLIGYNTELMALQKAEELLPGRMYHISKVWQCNQCQQNRDQAKFHKEALKILKDVHGKEEGEDFDLTP